MAGNHPASRYTELRRQEAGSPKLLYAVDAISAPDTAVQRLGELTSVARAAVAAGGGHVLDVTHVSFPNGAITLVLILAESHLSVHTWPEENLVAIDLFSCGAIDGAAVIGHLASELRLASVSVRELRRGVPSLPARRYQLSVTSSALPAKLAEAVVVDAEMVRDLVDDCPAHLLGHLGL